MSDDNNIQSSIPTSRLVPGLEAACLSMLDQGLDAAICISNDKYEYQYINEKFYHLFDINPEDLKVGDTLQDCLDLLLSKGLLTPEIIARNDLSRTAQKERHVQPSFESIVELANGRKIRLIRTKLPNNYTVSAAVNVSAYAEREHIFEDSLILGKAGYWILNLKTKKVILSKTLQYHFGKEFTKSVKKFGIGAVNAGTIPEDRHLLPQALKAAMAGDGKFSYVSQTLSQHNEIRRGETTGEILRDYHGKPIRIRAFVKDVTDEYEQAQALEKAKDAAIQASHAKSEFLANMSHEIRTPMNGVLGMAELLSVSNLDNRQKEYVKVINNSAQALLTIINDILDFSKIEAGALSLEPIPFDLHEAVDDVGALMQQAAFDKGLELVINYSPSLTRNFIGDGGRLRQVLNNLVSNAIKFTEKGIITVDIDVVPLRGNLNIVKMSVTDTGIGIAPNKLEDIFNKFTQADGSTTRLYGGTGLGLSITKCIVELMNGRIKVTSDLGKGSTFTCAIPLSADLEAVPMAYDTQSLSNRRILVVDDAEVNRHVLSEQLRAWNIDPVVAKDAAQALHILTTNNNEMPIDMVLLDYLMPDVDGVELARQITAHADIPPIPLMMLTSYDPPMDRGGLADCGIMDCMTKPVREQRLYDRLVKHFTSAKIEEQTPGSAAIEAPVRPASADGKVNILVAEDFALNQDVVRLMLSESPFVPVFADNGQIAVDLFTADPDKFAAILMDISMPVKDGYQAAQDILAFESETGRAHTSIIALTGHALKHDREKCLESGMDEYLSKPVKQDELLATLEACTGTAQAQTETQVA